MFGRIAPGESRSWTVPVKVPKDSLPRLDVVKVEFFEEHGAVPPKQEMQVRLDGSTLRISNFRREIAVPAADIVDVRQNLFWNPRPITVTFKKETAFGRAITFMPPTSLWPFSESEIVKRLRRLAAPSNERWV